MLARRVFEVFINSNTDSHAIYVYSSVPLIINNTWVFGARVLSIYTFSQDGVCSGFSTVSTFYNLLIDTLISFRNPGNSSAEIIILLDIILPVTSL